MAADGLTFQPVSPATRREGATSVEAYPVDPASPSYRYMGFVPAFEAAGFVDVGTAGSRRHVMRLTLSEADRGES